MNKLQQLIEAAKAATSPYADDWESKQALLKFDRAANPTTILELCDLLEKAEADLVRTMTRMDERSYRATMRGDKGYDTLRILDEIKQWRQI